MMIGDCQTPDCFVAIEFRNIVRNFVTIDLNEHDPFVAFKRYRFQLKILQRLTSVTI